MSVSFVIRGLMAGPSFSRINLFFLLVARIKGAARSKFLSENAVLLFLAFLAETFLITNWLVCP